MKPRHILTALGITTVLATTGIGVSYAATQTSTMHQPIDNLVQTLADKFHLDTTEVQKVFDEQHQQMKQQHHQAMADRLAQAVTNGKLTQAQADQITAKQAELEAQRDQDMANFQNMTETERHTAMKQKMSDLKQWAEANSISQEYLPFSGSHGGPHDTF